MNIKVHLFNIIKACNNAHLALFEFLSVLMKWRLFSCHCTELRLAKKGEGDNIAQTLHCVQTREASVWSRSSSYLCCTLLGNQCSVDQTTQQRTTRLTIKCNAAFCRYTVYCIGGDPAYRIPGSVTRKTFDNLFLGPQPAWWWWAGAVWAAGLLGRTIHLSVIIFLSEFLSQRPMIARFFCRAELVASSQSQIGILDLNIADFR